jgi:hypothetical protein
VRGWDEWAGEGLLLLLLLLRAYAARSEKKKTLTQPSPAKAGQGLQPNEKGRPVARAALIVDAPGAVD